MSKWLNLFLENEIVNRSDKSDRFKLETNMSPLSLRSRRFLDEKLKKVENNHSKGGDKSARFRFEANMSPLSLRPRGLLDQNLENMPEPDISDTFDHNINRSDLSGRHHELSEKTFSCYDEHDFEERLAIAEVDGNQNTFQAHRIAYLDAFISILWALAKDDPHQDWLDQKIQIALATLEAQNFPTHH